MRLKLPTEQIHYALALALTKGISFVMLPFYTYYLSTKAYGQLELLVVFTNLCSILLGFGLIETLYRFCANVDKERQPEVLNQLMLIGLTVALSAMAILMFFAESLNELLPGEFLISDLRLALKYLSILTELGYLGEFASEVTVIISGNPARITSV